MTQESKQPAHVVILNAVRERLEALRGADFALATTVASLMAVIVLLDVLGRMVIPKSARPQVLAELAFLAALWPDEGGPNLARTVLDFIAQDATAQEEARASR